MDGWLLVGMDEWVGGWVGRASDRSVDDDGQQPLAGVTQPAVDVTLHSR